MAEITIHGTRVVLRDEFPAKSGWGLLGAVRRIDTIRQERISEKLGREVTTAELLAKPMADDVEAAVNQVQWLNVIQENLAFDDAVKFVRGAVLEWDFPGDLKRADCCDGLNTIHEFMPLVTNAVLLFYAGNDTGTLRGEAESGSTSDSEG